ncbi:MAG TPA: cupin domain-containing protein [Bacteroidales bacterium]
MKRILSSIFSLLTSATFAQLPQVNAGVYRWADHPPKIGTDRETRRFLEGPSPHNKYLEIHATTQYPGAKPSNAHANKDIEELIIVKEGEMKATIDGKSTIIGAGGAFIVMPQQMQSFENVGTSNLSYFIMKYTLENPMNIQRGLAGEGSLIINADSLVFKPTEKGGVRSYFDRATAMCERMEMHVTQLNKKDPGHIPHSHLETEIILVISGETEMTIDGKEYTAGPGDFYFINSELFHVVRNAKDEPCSYFAFKWK